MAACCSRWRAVENAGSGRDGGRKIDRLKDMLKDMLYLFTKITLLACSLPFPLKRQPLKLSYPGSTPAPPMHGNYHQRFSHAIYRFAAWNSAQSWSTTCSYLRRKCRTLRWQFRHDLLFIGSTWYYLSAKLFDCVHYLQHITCSRRKYLARYLAMVVWIFVLSLLISRSKALSFLSSVWISITVICSCNDTTSA